MVKQIFDRTSIRTFEDKQVEKEKIESLMRAAMAAPTAKNTQPWEFVIVEDKDTILDLSEATPYAKPLKNAPLAIIVCANEERSFNISFAAQDCSAATQNILIEAVDLDLGTVWIGVHPRNKWINAIKKIIDFPEHIRPLWMIAVGYPKVQIKPKEKFNPEYVHFEGFKKVK